MLPVKCPAKSLHGILRYQNKEKVYQSVSQHTTILCPSSLASQKKKHLLALEHCSVFLKRIVFHPCHCSKWMLLKRTEVQQEKSTVRCNSCRAWVSGNGGLVIPLHTWLFQPPLPPAALSSTNSRWLPLFSTANTTWNMIDTGHREWVLYYIHIKTCWWASAHSFMDGHIHLLLHQPLLRLK